MVTILSWISIAVIAASFGVSTDSCVRAVVAQPQMPIAVKANMPEQEVQRITHCLLTLTKTDKGRKALAALGFKNGFIQANDAEYLGVH